MKIINIDASANLVKKMCLLDVQQFILDVVHPLEHSILINQNRCLLYPTKKIENGVKLPISPIRIQNEVGYENVYNLLHTIPIYLRETKPQYYDDIDIVDLLGAYYPNRKGDSPYIELYLSCILTSVDSDDLKYKWLITKVLIHELAHAALDIKNIESYHNNKKIKELVRYNTEFGKWREESMANAVALRIIHEYNDQLFYEFAKNYMLTQDPEYRLGVRMENFRYWDFRSVIESKVKGVDQDLQDEWLKDAKSDSIDWEGLKKWNKLYLEKAESL